jgi:hypothetical protein
MPPDAPHWESQLLLLPSTCASRIAHEDSQEKIPLCLVTSFWFRHLGSSTNMDGLPTLVANRDARTEINSF